MHIYLKRLGMFAGCALTATVMSACELLRAQDAADAQATGVGPAKERVLAAPVETAQLPAAFGCTADERKLARDTRENGFRYSGNCD